MHTSVLGWLLRAALLGSFVLAACGGGPSKPVTSVVAGQSDMRKLTMGKLRTYCASCHAIGSLRFIYSSDDEELWQYITSNKVPGTDRLWVHSIVEALSWPSDTAPPVEEIKWMPKGIKRLQLADDMTDGVQTRRLMIQALQE